MHTRCQLTVDSLYTHCILIVHTLSPAARAWRLQPYHPSPGPKPTGAIDGSGRRERPTGAVDGSDLRERSTGAIDGSGRRERSTGAIDGSDRRERYRFEGAHFGLSSPTGSAPKVECANFLSSGHDFLMIIVNFP